MDRLDPDVKELIEKLKSENTDGAYISAENSDRNDNAIVFKGNKQGLVIFALKILEPLLYVEYGRKFWIPYEYFGKGEIGMESVELIKILPQEKIREIAPETFKDHFAKIGCIAFVVFLIVMFIVGIVSTVKWLF